jgi:2-polyprenyl-3-methyl-5-hydroxy-6-metoxy-1,4-benzoquinol methylase
MSLFFKIKTKYQKVGFNGLIFSLINRVFIFIFNLKLEPYHSIKENKIAKRIFSKRKLKYNQEGFFFISPMPTKKELEDYYKNAYWESRSSSNINQILNRRDLVHYNLFVKFGKKYLTENNVFLNFGAGHGGLSHLMWSLGMEIINIEPSEIPINYDKRWSVFKEISCVKDNSIDIIYGSHSLEHVNDIDNFKIEIKRILKPNGILFFEVPNADFPGAGPLLNKIVIPHTYYFKKQFFNNWLNELILCESYEQNGYSQIESFIDNTNKEGQVIISMGKL